MDVGCPERGGFRFYMQDAARKKVSIGSGNGMLVQGTFPLRKNNVAVPVWCRLFSRLKPGGFSNFHEEHVALANHVCFFHTSFMTWNLASIRFLTVRRSTRWP